MSLTYVASTGRLFRANGTLLATCYSGNGDGKNNPAMQAVHDVGPIPVGLWKILGPPFHHEHAGPDVLRLEPAPGTDALGRSGFLIHGDFIDPAKRGTASHGCIIAPHDDRVAIWAEGDHLMQVVAALDPQGVA